MATSIDDELIAALQEDGRASFSALAEQLGVPRSVVSARVRELIESGAVRIVAAAAPAFLGESCLAHVSITGRGELSGVVEELSGRDDIPLVSAISGSQDLVVEVRAADHEALFEVLAQVRSFPEVARIRTAIYTEVLRGSFVSDYDGGGRVDEIDSELVELLRHDGRISYRDLARQVRLSPTAVRSRVRRMLDDRILRISAVVTHSAHARRVKVGVGLHLGGEDESVARRLMGYPETEFAAMSIGPFDLIATLASSVPGDVFARLDDLKGLPGVTGMETWFHLKTLKEDYSRAI
ncbi:Lrp/AsnC family transcriptional regulator [Nesterenkonia sp. CL21]|uniref:Lrp/AsnC family transcriptional regulator n=1 Tax=Nesterenkonia sp. CL21 TaxID=3064894 RepID=UPI002879BC83|nr:Lrp/AsnC family transcriptional regulator [Nesterenkonia sp. CL21]MDS2173082.1 Lrp/AsnC family transcriptional regulator [Nesterenkonia sp. CL21]